MMQRRHKRGAGNDAAAFRITSSCPPAGVVLFEFNGLLFKLLLYFIIINFLRAKY